MLKHCSLESESLGRTVALHIHVPECETPRRFPTLYIYDGGADFSRLRYCCMDIGDKDAERLRFTVIPGGTHSLATWRQTFPDALRWIFQDYGGTIS